MYKITVKTAGREGITSLGARYCFTKRTVIKLAVLFSRDGCEFDVEKFVRLHDDLFAWSDADVSEKIWDTVWEVLDKEKGKE